MRVLHLTLPPATMCHRRHHNLPEVKHQLTRIYCKKQEKKAGRPEKKSKKQNKTKKKLKLRNEKSNLITKINNILSQYKIY